MHAFAGGRPRLEGNLVSRYFWFTSFSASLRCPLWTACVGEWNRRPWCGSEWVFGYQFALSHVVGQWRSRVGRWLLQSSYFTAERSTTTAPRPRRLKLSTEAVLAEAVLLQQAHITPLRSTQQWVVAAVYCHLSIQCRVLGAWLIIIDHPGNCLHDLLPPERDPSVSLRLRHSTVYPIPQVRTKQYCSFINYSLKHYQW